MKLKKLPGDSGFAFTQAAHECGHQRKVRKLLFCSCEANYMAV